MEDNKNKFKYYVGVKFSSASRTYYFGTDIDDICVDQKVVVETVRGKEVATTVTALIDINDYNSPLPLAPIIRIATDVDIRFLEQNKIDALEAEKIFNEEARKLNLDMHLIKGEYTLDKAKITFTYAADDRVDFRELLKVLAYRLRTRIDLRQIGPRDKAKLVGGIGLCGLELCCSKFLNEFDGVSINRAKNQMLAINIPKLSGQCGKLICCLKYEDDTYTKEKELYPSINETLKIDGKDFVVNSYNIVSKKINLSFEEENITLSLEEFNAKKYPPKEEKQFKKKKFFNNKNKHHEKK